MDKIMSQLKKILAKRCDNCPICNYARKNPDTTFGKLMKWHGKWCPFWKAWEEIYKPQDSDQQRHLKD